MPENALGSKLKKLRKEKNLTQGDLDNALGFSERYTSKIESGVKPSMTKLRKIADFFKVPIEYLVAESEDTNIVSAVIRNKEILEAFIEVDKMNSADQNVLLEVIRAFIAKNKVKDLFDVKK